MKNQLCLNIGGVPEHFNYPWHLVLQHNLLEKYNISFKWHNQPGGTGAMLKALENKEIDMAILLTEGGINGIANGQQAKIIGTYVSSSLNWGVHVNAQSNINQIADLENGTFAISRLRSGSHLMSYVLAQQNNWNTEKLNFEIIGNLEGARKAMATNDQLGFLWEKYTTMPYCDNGEFKRVGECPTPWPCFVMLANNEIIESYAEELKLIMKTVRKALHLYNEEKTMKFISDFYSLKINKVEEWYAQTQWWCRPSIALQAIELAQNTLYDLKRIDKKLAIEHYVADFCTLTEQPLSEIMYDWRVKSLQKAMKAGGKSVGTLAVTELQEFENLIQHQRENDVRDFAERLELNHTHHIADLGSGTGNISRLMAHITNCKVTAIELQTELNNLAEDLTQRTGLQDRVTHFNTDFFTLSEKEQFDSLLCLMLFMHIHDRQAAFEKCNTILKTKGAVIIEDIVALNTPTSEEQDLLKDMLGINSISSIEKYKKDLEKAGFTEVEIVDLSNDWKEQAKIQYEQLKTTKTDYRNYLQQRLYDKRLLFFSTVYRILSNGNIGGIGVVCYKK